MVSLPPGNPGDFSALQGRCGVFRLGEVYECVFGAEGQQTPCVAL